jgi:diguanylate cyclase (GGDEF)-like protein
MNNDDRGDIQAALKQLKIAFIEKIPAKIKEIEQTWQTLQSAPNNDEVLQLLHRLTHTLAGTAATFNLEMIAENAKQIENTLQSLTLKPIAKLPVQDIDLLLEKLTNAAAFAKTSSATIIKPANVPQALKKNLSIDTAINNLVYLVDDDEDFTHTIKMQIQTFGYQVQAYSSLAVFSEALKHQEPAVVIMDVMFGDSKTAGIDYIAKLNNDRAVPLQTIFITGSHDIHTRLNAVRANGLAYFTKPVLISSLIDALDKMSDKVEDKPYRVLIVDDSKIQSQHAALTLQQAGMKTKEVNDPLHLLNTLSEFSPDLILMDLYMPNCTGIELSQVIRQMENFVGTPIVFLSSEDDLGKKLGALSLGGDDFLTKPIKPWHLISAISSRAQRARLIRKLAETDGLTGLLNHSKSKECLKNELSRAKRDNTPLSFAMLDLDLFKKVNDTYGHPVGDRVLKNIANMFKQRLRKYDIVGRYGGEEFIMILPNTDAEAAKKIIDVIRVRFSELVHYSDEDEFFCTFSCGIASFPQFSNAKEISDEADKALYQAKQAGRNQVICAKDE